jgi:hypothetical protein
VRGPAAGCAGFVRAFWTGGRVRAGADVLRWYPSGAGGVGAVDSVAGWDGPFGFALAIFLDGARGEV